MKSTDSISAPTAVIASKGLSSVTGTGNGSGSTHGCSVLHGTTADLFFVNAIMAHNGEASPADSLSSSLPAAELPLPSASTEPIINNSNSGSSMVSSKAGPSAGLGRDLGSGSCNWMSITDEVPPKPETQPGPPASKSGGGSFRRGGSAWVRTTGGTLRYLNVALRSSTVQNRGSAANILAGLTHIGGEMHSSVSGQQQQQQEEGELNLV